MNVQHYIPLCHVKGGAVWLVTNFAIANLS